MSSKSKEQKEVTYKSYGYTRTNLWILLASIAVIILGYLLMAGGGSDAPNIFNEAVFSTRRISIAPMVTTVGYIGVIIAIIWRKRR